MEQTVLWNGDGFGGDLFLVWDFDNAVRRRFNTFCLECGHPEWGDDVDPVDDFVVLELLAEDDDGTALYKAADRLGQYIWLRPAEDAASGWMDAASGWMDSDPRVEEAIDAIESANSLDELADALNAVCDPDVTQEVGEYFEFRDYPVFGGEEPDDTTCVWSWDQDRLLVGESLPFEIVSRQEWDEARGE